VRSQRVTIEKPDLSPVFGRLDSSERSMIQQALARAEQRLFTLRQELTEQTNRSWRSRGIELETYPSGQASIGGYVQDGEVTFAVELRPHNFFHEAPWRPGEPTRRMSTDAWDVDATIYVISDAGVEAGQDAAAELPARRRERPGDAAAALVEVCLDLHELARSRPPEPRAWRRSAGT
jgi:hypothetical protein